MKQQDRTRQTRREFLGGVLAGGTATALLATGALADNLAEPVSGSTEAGQKSEGYHLTEHIRTYYQKAQI